MLGTPGGDLGIHPSKNRLAVLNRRHGHGTVYALDCESEGGGRQVVEKEKRSQQGEFRRMHLEWVVTILFVGGQYWGGSAFWDK